MKLSDDLIFTILNFICERSDYGFISFQYREIPGEYSNRQIHFHLEYCKNKDFVMGRLSADKIMAEVALTAEGLSYLQGQN